MWKVWSIKGFDLEKSNEQQFFISLRIWTGFWALPLSVEIDPEAQQKNTKSIIITLLCLSLKLTIYRPD